MDKAYVITYKATDIPACDDDGVISGVFAGLWSPNVYKTDEEAKSALDEIAAEQKAEFEEIYMVEDDLDDLHTTVVVETVDGTTYITVSDDNDIIHELALTIEEINF